jgi:hypothetical protein
MSGCRSGYYIVHEGTITEVSMSWGAWCIIISIFKGATRLPCQRLWLEVSYVRCAIMTSGMCRRTHASFLFQSYSDP